NDVPLLGGAGQIAWTDKALYCEPIIVTGRVGTLGVISRWVEPTWPSDNTLILRTGRENMFHFVFHHLGRIDFQSLNRGSTQPLVTQRDIKRQRISIPPETKLSKFHDLVSLFYSRVEHNKAESRTLADLRDTLLPKLISGELRVSDAELAVAEAL
ncbi:MAG: restriction endonuclease subunit S, partial [Bradymonadaceae bacterium]